MQVMETQPPPVPWRKVAAHAIDGWMFGFAEQSDLLFIVSTTGCEVFDCTSGESIARQEEDLTWLNWGRLALKGIGPLDGQIVRLAGLYGGGLNTVTKEGWRLYAVTPTWPDYRVLLFPPKAQSFDDLAACIQVEQLQDILTVGFSPTGRSFIVAQHHLLHVYARA